MVLNLPRCDDNSVGISFPDNGSKNRCSNLLNSLLSLKGKGNPFDHHEMFFTIIRTLEFDV